MVDTRRALADIQSLFADNTAGDISAQDLRDFVVSVYGADALFTGATKTASFTAAVGQIYPVNVSSATANIDVTFPSTPAAGDTFGFYVATASTTVGASGFAQAPYWGVEPLATTSINGTSYTQATGDGVGKWGLMLRGEVLIFRYDAVASTWMVNRDGRQMAVARIGLSAAQTTNSAATWTDIDHDESYIDTWSLLDSATGYLEVKRTGNYSVGQGYQPASGIASTESAGVRVTDGTTVFCSIRVRQTSITSSIIGATTAGIADVLAGASLRYQLFTQSANNGIRITYEVSPNTEDGITCGFANEER